MADSLIDPICLVVVVLLGLAVLAYAWGLFSGKKKMGKHFPSGAYPIVEGVGFKKAAEFTEDDLVNDRTIFKFLGWDRKIAVPNKLIPYPPCKAAIIVGETSQVWKVPYDILGKFHPEAVDKGLTGFLERDYDSRKFEDEVAKNASLVQDNEETRRSSDERLSSALDKQERVGGLVTMILEAQSMNKRERKE